MSSMVFLGLSMIAFIISFGLVWILVPVVLGSFFGIINDSGLLNTMSTAWQNVYHTNENRVQWLIPLSVQLGIFVLILKVLLVASTRGGD